MISEPGSIKVRYYVKRINKSFAIEWVEKKHYAKRRPIMQYAFGIFNSDNTLSGVCIFSPSPSRRWNKGGSLFKHKHIVGVMELSRLVLNDGHEKNLGSFFISQCLKILPNPPHAIVSFADMNNNHCGYIYQATNFIYTGLAEPGSKSGDWILNGKRHHGKSMDLAKVKKLLGNKYDPTLGLIENFKKSGGVISNQLPKHRYIYINHKKKELLIKDMIYNPQPYPKTENKRYDSSYIPSIQTELF